MGVISKLITLATLAFGTWMLTSVLSMIISLYFPNIHVPYIYPIKEGIRKLPKHELAWPVDYEYIVSSYLSPIFRITSYDFFDSAQLVYRSPNLIAGKGNHINFANNLDNTKSKKDFIGETVDFYLPQSFLKNNGSLLYLHTFVHSKAAMLSIPGESGDVIVTDLSDPLLVANVVEMVKYQPISVDARVQLLKKEVKPELNLDENAQSTEKDVYIPHLKTKVDLEIVLERHEFPKNRFPSDIVQFIRLARRDNSQNPGKPLKYLPLFWENPLATREDHYTPIRSTQNSTQEDDSELGIRLNFNLKFRVVQLGWFRLSVKLLQAISILSVPGSPIHLPKAEISNIKQMIYDSNSNILLMTFIASILHMVFEFLAYKEDISFYTTKSSKSSVQSASLDDSKSKPASVTEEEESKTKTELATEEEAESGQFDSISRSASLMRAFGTFIGCLYLWDQRDSASFLVVFGSIVGTCVEVWKLFKIFNIYPFSVSPTPTNNKSSTPKVSEKTDLNKKTDLDKKIDLDKETNSSRKRINSSNDKGPQTQEDKPSKKTISKEVEIRNKVDRQTGQVMMYLGIPLTIIYGIYSLIFGKHTGYVSYFVHIALSSVYLLEFIQMFPQLLINYYLQSVESLPLTAFCYRFLTTFIDDLFAMVVPMPLLTRIGTFRDDIVFFILCYQWWKYPRRSKKQKTL
ncbi:Cleft lip and palate transmembrane protein 1-like protein [Smittium mucronatum]|uniref:Cleft lip and palate transmembrane protein 1-like protein n=1 Tax=Smittium mucronatum TaxID=133383 RepID=A0A1R0H2T3_9FUNG|nr:Cleft lip and palate transmembrane protein 1-like protein [Smittium mucronatum]